jgi:hypothetical protein
MRPALITVAVPASYMRERNILLNAVSNIPSYFQAQLTMADCGNTLAAGSGPADAGDCSMTCTGNTTEACGGPNRLNLFWSGTTGPQTNPGYGNWTFSGCYAYVTSTCNLSRTATDSAEKAVKIDSLIQMNAERVPLDELFLTALQQLGDHQK